MPGLIPSGHAPRPRIHVTRSQIRTTPFHNSTDEPHHTATEQGAIVSTERTAKAGSLQSGFFTELRTLLGTPGSGALALAAVFLTTAALLAPQPTPPPVPTKPCAKHSPMALPCPTAAPTSRSPRWKRAASTRRGSPGRCRSLPMGRGRAISRLCRFWGRQAAVWDCRRMCLSEVVVAVGRRVV